MPDHAKFDQIVADYLAANEVIVTAANCWIRAAHTPHSECPGTAPEFPWERIIVVEARDA